MTEKHYIPDVPEVLHFITVMQSLEGAQPWISRVTEEPGDYPYLCSFEGTGWQ